MIMKMFDTKSRETRYIEITEEQLSLLHWLMDANAIHQDIEFDECDLPKVEKI